MMRLPDDRAYRERLAATRAADAAHDAEMRELCARGGKTLEQVRAMGRVRKDAFIFKHRNKEPKA